MTRMSIIEPSSYKQRLYLTSGNSLDVNYNPVIIILIAMCVQTTEPLHR